MRKWSLIALLVIFGSSAYGQQQSTRAEQLRRQRLEKKSAAEPEEAPLLERTFLLVEETGFANLFALGYKKLYPQIGSIAPRSGLAFGARYSDSDLSQGRLTVQSSAAASLQGYQLVDFQFGKMPSGGRPAFLSPVAPNNLSADPFNPERHENSRSFLYGDVTYRKQTRVDFFGVGNESELENRSNFQIRDASFDFVAAAHVRNFFGLALRGGYLDFALSDGRNRALPSTLGLPEAATIPGLVEEPDFLHLTAAAWLDYRDHKTHPHLGGVVFASLTRFADRDAGRFDFNRFRFDTRQFVPLWSTQRILAFRFLTVLDTADSGAGVPFFLQETLGGSQTLRGFRNFRFRDQNLLYLSAEYRWEPAAAVELAVFYDAGKVFSHRSDFEFKHLQKSIGAGIRFKTPDVTFLRLDIGRSREGTLLHFSFGASF